MHWTRLGERKLSPWLVAAVLELAVLVLPAAGIVGGAWKPQGPGPITNGQAEGISNPVNNPETGAVQAVVPHPTNSDILWIGTVNGGIFRTDNATSANPSWIPQTDSQASLSISSLELDPTDTTYNTLVAGIGSRSSYYGIGGAYSGILRTTNGGAIWTLLSRSISGLIITGVAPRGATIVIATYGGGIYRSINGGIDFTPISGSIGSGLPFGDALSLVGDPTNNSRLFTIIRQFSLNGGIYRSDNTGATWTKVSNSSQDELIATSINAILAVGRAGPATPNVYAAICNLDSQLVAGGLFRTGNGSAATPVWTVLDAPGTTEMGTFYGIHPGHQCYYHFSLAADPGNPNIAFIGGDRQPANNENGQPGVGFPNSLGAFDYSGRLFKVDASEPAGSQATPITHCKTASAACGSSSRTVSNSAPHADSRKLVFDSMGKLIEADDGGIYKHTSPGGSNGDWKSLNGNLSVTEQHDVEYDSISNVIFSGNQDTGTSLQASLDNPIWGSFIGGDGNDVQVAANHPIGSGCSGAPPCSTRYFGFQNTVVAYRAIYDSTNHLQSLTIPTLTPLGSDPVPVGRFVTPLKVNAANPARVVFGANNGVYESTDDLETVALISSDLISGLGGGTISYGTVDNPNVLYYGSHDRVFVRTAAPPAAPVNTDPDPGDTSDISGIAMNPNNANEAFAVNNGKVFRTTNAGASWSNVTGSLVAAFSTGTLHSVTYLARASGNGVVVGSDRGVFIALESSGFATWDRLGSGLPNTPVWDLSDAATYDILVAGTLGRGSWALSPVCIAAVCPTLSVALAGDGGGGVVSKPGGINCGSNCSASYALGSSVTLTAIPAPSSVFAGWSGACSGTGSCTVTMDVAKTVTATFKVQTFALGISRNGSGGGTVTSQPGGISCGATCSAPFPGGAVVTLTATPALLSTFAGWSGACSGTGQCVVTMDRAKAVTATFNVQTFTLRVSKLGTGTGTVTSNPKGISCGASCSASFNGGAVVTLTVKLTGGSIFAGWSGACTGKASCVVTMNAAKSVTASLRPRRSH